MRLKMLAAAFLVEAAFGYPDALFKRVGHPVSWAGWLIARLDTAWNDPGCPAPVRRARGAGAIVGVVLVSGSAGRLIARGGRPAVIVAASSLLAARSLHEHVAAVATGLDHGLDGGRGALSRIVGRDTANLDAPAIARAAIESLAENFSDGVVAPALWFALGGLPAMAAYKAVNTADSMIGHLDERHAAFGWASARLDDLVNLPAARLSALLITAASGRPVAALRAVVRDARRHRSPNAGWPEAAMAGGLGIELAGPRSYAGRLVTDATMGASGREAHSADIARALRVYRAACLSGVALITVGAALKGRGSARAPRQGAVGP